MARVPSRSLYETRDVTTFLTPLSLSSCANRGARGALGARERHTARIMDVSKLQEKKAALEEELLRTEENIYDLEGEYLQACAPELLLPTSPGRADGCVPAPGRRR